MSSFICSRWSLRAAKGTAVPCILVNMIGSWNYRGLPIRLQHLLAVSLLIALAFWAQQGFHFQANHVLFVLCNYLTWFLLLPQVYQLVLVGYKWGIKKWLQLSAAIVVLVVAQWLASNLLLSVSKYLFLKQDFLQDYQEIATFLLPSLIIRIFDLTLFCALLLWLHQQRLLAQKKVAYAESQALVHESKLQALKSQLNPHFLFNALHHINAKIGTDDEGARDMTLRISVLLRKLLAINQLDAHPLAEEVDFAKMYLDIESKRFSDRLDVQLSIEEEATHVVVPTMILQPLFENAFKHGIATSERKAQLALIVRLEKDTLEIIVTNPCQPEKAEQSRQGIGLQNLADRLKLYYGPSARVVTDRSATTYSAQLLLPL